MTPPRNGSWSIGGGTGEEIVRTLSRTFSGHNVQEEDRYSIGSDESTSKAEDWKFMDEVKEMRMQTEKDNGKGRSLGVTWQNLTVSLTPRVLPVLVSAGI